MTVVKSLLRPFLHTPHAREKGNDSVDDAQIFCIKKLKVLIVLSSENQHLRVKFLLQLLKLQIMKFDLEMILNLKSVSSFDMTRVFGFKGQHFSLASYCSLLFSNNRTKERH